MYSYPTASHTLREKPTTFALADLQKWSNAKTSTEDPNNKIERPDKSALTFCTSAVQFKSKDSSLMYELHFEQYKQLWFAANSWIDNSGQADQCMCSACRNSEVPLMCKLNSHAIRLTTATVPAFICIHGASVSKECVRL